MTPEELAQHHPNLFHVTGIEAVDGILARGLLPTTVILEHWGVGPDKCEILLTKRRKLPTSLHDASLGSIVINDNAPLSEKKLAAVLDDGLSPPDWLRMLNERVFFFVDSKPLRNLLGAKLNSTRPKAVLVLDTYTLTQSYSRLMEIVPINSGNTLHVPARRGRSTFAPLLETDYRSWRRARGNKSLDRIKEVAVRGSIPDIARFVTEVRQGVFA